MSRTPASAALEAAILKHIEAKPAAGITCYYQSHTIISSGLQPPPDLLRSSSQNHQGLHAGQLNVFAPAYSSTDTANSFPPVQDTCWNAQQKWQGTNDFTIP